MDIYTESKERYTRIASSELAGLGATKQKIWRLLKTLDLCGWSTREESGRLDRRALTRYAAGSAAIFSRREYKEAETAAVSVLVDCSSSMTFALNENCTLTGEAQRIEIAQEIVIHLAKILNSAGSSFSINGFTSSGVPFKDNFDYETKTGTEQTALIGFKGWNESLNLAAAKLGNMHRQARGCTPDYAAIYSILEEIRLRPENKKVVFLVTDSDGYNKNNMKHLQKMADTFGIKLVAIGIGAPDVTECFDKSISVDKADELAGASFKHLLDSIKK